MKKNPYQTEYEYSDKCFWERKPGKYIKCLINDLGFDPKEKDILDIGAGEGKNAVYLASLGGYVTAIDSSSVALSRFRLQPMYDLCKDNIKIICGDVREFTYDKEAYDLIVCYGLLHSLDNSAQVYHLIDNIKKTLRESGYLVIVTFTNLMPPPKNQEYLSYDAFVDKDEFLSCFEGYSVLFCEEETIKESHPTDHIEHYHSLIRVIVKKGK